MEGRRDQDHPLLQFTRDDTRTDSLLQVDLAQPGHPVTEYLLGNFLENLTFSIVGGISAQVLVNPTFNTKHHLTPKQLQQFITNGEALVKLYLSGGNPAALRHGWISTPLPTGFGVCLLDDAMLQHLPLGWSPLGYPGAAIASVGRLGGAVRLQGGVWPDDPDLRWPVLEDGPAGIRQGMFLPVRRCLTYKGDLWVRAGTKSPEAHGEVELGFRRRVSTSDGRRHAGECLASVRISCTGAEWQRLDFELQLKEGQVTFGEPIDFYLRWIPRSQPELNLLVDRAFLVPGDEQDGLDPEVVELVRSSTMPILRWPGGNFVSHYHWRDSIGPLEQRPTRPNYAWGGLDYNIFGTDEFIGFCRKVGTRPHITVNTGTGTPEEAAAWVEYCNGAASTPMGKLRAQNGHPDPYNITMWEVGNEIFGAWQGGFHGSDENARRFAEFATAMRAASPIPIELIACGNNFDFAEGGLGYDHTAADRRWHEQLLTQAPDQIDYISLHSLPLNDLLLENLTDQQAHQAVLAQVVTWERRFLPELLERCDHAERPEGAAPITLAITEWGALGEHPNRLMVENFGGAIYAGTYLNMVIRNSERIPLSMVNGFMHGGCIRKAYGVVYSDPQFVTMQQYTPFQGATPLACRLTGPGYDVPQPTDLGGIDADIPFVDAVVCKPKAGYGLLVAAANRHLTQQMELTIQIPGHQMQAEASVLIQAYPQITARATPFEPEFPLAHSRVATVAGTVTVQLPPFSVAWIDV